MRLIGETRIMRGIRWRHAVLHKRLHGARHPDATAVQADRRLKMTTIGARQMHAMHAHFIRQGLQIHAIRIRLHGVPHAYKPGRGVAFGTFRRL